MVGGLYFRRHTFNWVGKVLWWYNNGQVSRITFIKQNINLIHTNPCHSLPRMGGMVPCSPGWLQCPSGARCLVGPRGASLPPPPLGQCSWPEQLRASSPPPPLLRASLQRTPAVLLCPSHLPGVGKCQAVPSGCCSPCQCCHLEGVHNCHIHFVFSVCM